MTTTNDLTLVFKSDTFPKYFVSEQPIDCFHTLYNQLTISKSADWMSRCCTKVYSAAHYNANCLEDKLSIPVFTILNF